MHHLSITDLDRIEDIAASAAMAGAQAAHDLADLGLSDTSRATHLAWIAKVLTSDALYDDASLVALAEFERELRGLVNREVYHTPPYGWQDAEGDLSPDCNLTLTGRRIEDVRANLALAIEGARYTRSLLAAERYVGKARGLSV